MQWHEVKVGGIGGRQLYTKLTMMNIEGRPDEDRIKDRTLSQGEREDDDELLSGFIASTCLEEH